MIIKRKFYSNGVKEKEFTSLAFKSKAVIGRVRRNLANRIQKSMDIDYQKMLQASNKISKDNGVRSTIGIDKYLGKTVQNSGATLKNVSLYGNTVPKRLQNYTIDFDKLNKDQIDQLTSFDNKIKNAYSRGKNAILSPKNGGGVELRSHKVGHSVRAKSKNPVTKLITKIANNPETREVINAGGDQGGKKGLLDAIKGYIKSSAVIAEERGASKTGLKLLKKGGMSKEDLKKSKESLDAALETYKRGRSRMWKSPLRELVNIPSRRLE